MDILAIPMKRNDSGAKTIGGYLRALLKELWAEGEGFSGKRPFGNSGWEYDLYKALIQAKAIRGEFDSCGDIGDFDQAAANKLIFKAIEAMGTMVMK